MGAVPLYIDAAEHDQYVAAVSHLPILISVALFRMARDSAGWEDASLLSGPGFRDLTRLASGDPTMARDILATNREAVLHWLHRFRTSFHDCQGRGAGGQPVMDLLSSTQLDRDTFILNPPLRPARRRHHRALRPRDAIGRLFVGGLYDRMKEMSSRPASPRDDAELRRKLGIPDEPSGR
ncbi:MAG: prephenate dehydrogenase [Thermoflexaceae bacterium]|nr:prephenate dehydrogenase [Thermoflexaceae bacterium]